MFYLALLSLLAFLGTSRSEPFCTQCYKEASQTSVTSHCPLILKLSDAQFQIYFKCISDSEYKVEDGARSCFGSPIDTRDKLNQLVCNLNDVETSLKNMCCHLTEATKPVKKTAADILDMCRACLDKAMQN